MLIRELVEAGRTTRSSVTRGEAGWVVRAERDNAMVREAQYTDWHRVERAVRSLETMPQDEPDDLGSRFRAH